MWSICLIETTFYHSLSLLLFYLPAPFFPSTSDQTAFLSVVHFHILLSSPPSFLLPYINYLLPQSATSGSCFTFSCPFITPASFRSLSRAPIFFKNFSPSLRHLYSGLSFPLIRVLIIRPRCTTLLFFLPFTLSSLSSPSLLHHLLRSSVSPNFHTALQPADCLISASTHTHKHRLETIHTFKHRHSHTFPNLVTYRSRKTGAWRIYTLAFSHTHAATDTHSSGV